MCTPMIIFCRALSLQKTVLLLSISHMYNSQLQCILFIACYSCQRNYFIYLHNIKVFSSSGIHVCVMKFYFWTSSLWWFQTIFSTQWRKAEPIWLSSLYEQTNYQHCFEPFSLQWQLRSAWHALHHLQQLSSESRAQLQRCFTQTL